MNAQTKTFLSALHFVLAVFLPQWTLHADPSGTALMDDVSIPTVTRYPFALDHIDSRCIGNFYSNSLSSLSVTNTSGVAAIVSSAVGGSPLTGINLNGGYVDRLYVKSGAGLKSRSFSIIEGSPNQLSGGTYSGTMSFKPFFNVLVSFIAEPEGATTSLQTNSYSFIRDPSSTTATPTWHGKSLQFSYGFKEMTAYPLETGSYLYNYDEDCGG